MKKITILLNVLFFIAIKCNAGSFIDGYRSIGYWIGGGASLIAEKGTYERHHDNTSVYYSFSQKVINLKNNSQTTIASSHGDDLSINDVYEVNKWELLKEVGIVVNGVSRSNVSVYVLPNDNILYIVDLERTLIKGTMKLQDRVEKIYGYPFVIEGATVPLKETEISSWGFILDHDNFYRTINAFPVPSHTEFLSSVNGRMYFLNDIAEKEGNEVGFKELYCYNLNGTYMWKYHNNTHSEWFGTFQETIDNLYIAGAEKKDDGNYYGVVRVLNLNGGKTVNTIYGEKVNGAYFIYSNYFKDGFEYGYELGYERKDGGRLSYIKEDANFKTQIEKDWDEIQENIRMRTNKTKEIVSSANLEEDFRNMFNEANEYRDKVSEVNTKQEKMECLRKADSIYEIIQNTPNIESVVSLDFIKLQREAIKKQMETVNAM